MLDADLRQLAAQFEPFLTTQTSRMKPSDFSARTVAGQAAEFLRDSLRAGRWRRQMPSERALAEEMRVSRPTLRKAMEELAGEGWLAKTQGHLSRILTRNTPGAVRQKQVVMLVGHHELQKDWYAMGFIETIRRQLAVEGVRLELVSSEKLHWANSAVFLKRLVRQYTPQAWILQSQTDTVQRWFAAHSLHAVVLGSLFPGVSLSFVDIDRRATCRHALGVFTRLGHRRIRYYSRATDAAGDFLSEQAFEESRPRCKLEGIQVVRHDGTAKQMWNEARRWKRQGDDRPTALMASHWEDALALTVELLRMGIGIPREVSIISRDSSAVFERVSPRIACYHFDPARHARALCRILRGGKATCQWLIPKIDKGESLAPPPLLRYNATAGGKL